jgi:hypothetical protein
MSTLAEIEAAAEALSAQEKTKLLEFLTAKLASSPLTVSGAGRRAGLHAGAWEVAEDFDAPLPDEFWLGA